MSVFFPGDSIYGPRRHYVGVVTTASLQAGYDMTCGFATTQGSAVWPLANRAIFYPVEVAIRRLVTHLCFRNGSVVSGNADVGIYAPDGTQLVAIGGVAMAGTQSLQVADVTDTLLDPGIYMVGMAVDNVTAQPARYAPSTTLLNLFGVREMASAYPLPATATFATPSSAYLPVFGYGMMGVL